MENQKRKFLRFFEKNEDFTKSGIFMIMKKKKIIITETQAKKLVEVLIKVEEGNKKKRCLN